MGKSRIDQGRVYCLHEGGKGGGKFVLYWMQAAVRAQFNHALEFAVEKANEAGLPVVVVFVIVEDFPEGNERHYRFMLEGLAEVEGELEERGIKLVVQKGSMVETVTEMVKGAEVLVTDAGHLRIQRRWREEIAGSVGCDFFEVETNLVVPVDMAYEKESYSAGTLRPKINKQVERFLRGLGAGSVRRDSLGLRMKGEDASDVDKVLAGLKIDRGVGAVDTFRGGTSEAKRLLKEFISKKLSIYAEGRNDPNCECVSNMSPYLHFGQISPVYIALEVKKKGGKGAAELLEELIVRRELSHNFVFYNDRYDSWNGVAEWARRTLNFHKRDKRQFVYSREEFERAQTHDEYWNAAQKEMMIGGKMAGYMRMYWGKKILEWSERPEEAFATALYLNNKYELDGRDPNGFAGVAWCFGKHDRAWQERDVLGKVRYMNEQGLKRKFDADKYVERVRRMSEEA